MTVHLLPDFFVTKQSPARTLTPAKGTGQIASVSSEALGVAAHGAAVLPLQPWSTSPVQNQSLVTSDLRISCIYSQIRQNYGGFCCLFKCIKHIEQKVNKHMCPELSIWTFFGASCRNLSFQFILAVPRGGSLIPVLLGVPATCVLLLRHRGQVLATRFFFLLQCSVAWER